MVKQTRPDDRELIESMADEGAPSAQGRSGGNVARNVGTRAELHRIAGNLNGDEVERATGSDNPSQNAVKGDKTFDKIRSGQQNG